MLIARAPFRISLAGGGTDLPAYYEQFGGSVISTTIDKYFYVVLHVSNDQELQISSADYRTFYRHDPDQPLGWDGDLSLPRAILHEFGVWRGVRVFLASEVPPGTGLGSSSAVAVALIKAVSTACGLNLTPAKVAETACAIEISKLNHPIGKQDQYAAAYGNLNAISFSRQGVEVERLRIPQEVRARLQKNILLFYTGAARDSAAILQEQTSATRRRTSSVIDALHAVKEVAGLMRRALEHGDLTAVGELLNVSWEQKKRFATGVSTPLVEECYVLARKNGAAGGKLTGAGGGGFLMLYCEPHAQSSVTSALESRGLKRMNFAFSQSGARVLMHASLNLPSESTVAQ